MKKNMKKITAAAMAAALVFAAPITAGATAGSGATSGTAPTSTAASASVYFKENVTAVVVPTKLTVAFNPDNLNILVDGEEKTDDIVSRPVAIVSEATKNKKVAVSFAVTSTNSNIKFVDTQAAANTGTDLNVCLQLVAANGTTGITLPSGASGTTAIAVNSGTRTYAPATLAKANMVAAGSGTSGTVTIKNNTAVGFKLDSASYDYTSIDLDTGSGATSNKISGTLAGLGTTGYSAFNFTGYLNDNADWYGVGDSTTISITPTYTVTDAASTDTAITGTAGFLGTTTAATATPTATMTSYSRASTNNTITLSNLGDLTVSSIDVSTDGTTVGAAVPNTAYTVAADKSSITIDGTKAPIGAGGVGQKRYFIINLSDNTKLTVEVTVAN